MPSIDMPLHELKRYEGTNPKPDDFDAFWSTALKEVYQLPIEYRLVSADVSIPYADCHHMYFYSIGGAEIHAQLLTPTGKGKPTPALLNFHGYGMTCGSWFEKLPYVAAGFTVAAMDCRGQGGKSHDIGGVAGNTLQGHLIRGIFEEPSRMLMRNVFLDTVQLARIMMSLSEIDADKVGVYGRSQGAGLSLACAALVPQIAKVAIRYPFLSDYKRIWEMDLGEDAFQEIRNYFRSSDPRHGTEDELFHRLGYIDVQHLATQIQGEVIMASTLMDTVAPPSTQFAVFNKVQAQKKLYVYPDYGHETLPDYDDIVFSFLSELLSNSN